MVARRESGSPSAVFTYNGRSAFTSATVVSDSVTGNDCSCVLSEERLRAEEDRGKTVLPYIDGSLTDSDGMGADGMGRACSVLACRGKGVVSTARGSENYEIGVLTLEYHELGQTLEYLAGLHS